LASAVLMNLLKKQDAIGWVFFQIPMNIMPLKRQWSSSQNGAALENLLVVPTVKNGYYPVLAPDSWKNAQTFHDYIVYGYVSTDSDDNALFSALQHLRHNKHKVVLFHVVDKTELWVYRCGDWRNRCGFSDNVKEEYENRPLCFKKKVSVVVLKIKLNTFQWMSVMILKSFIDILSWKTKLWVISGENIFF
jgi:hypothetical protein